MAGSQSSLVDPTAMMLGRLTLNPVKHIDPVGTVLVPSIAADSRRLRVRMGQAGAGDLAQPQTSETGHGVSGVGGSGCESPDGGGMGAGTAGVAPLP